ncbi:hypothetical protein AB6D02_18525 [Vibrio splendidus]
MIAKRKFLIIISPVIITLFLFLVKINSGIEIFRSVDTSPCNGVLLCQINKVHALVIDDVSITLRVAKHFLEHGDTNFNITDSAQAATSYILPIIASPLFVLPDAIAVLIFSFFGFLSVYISWLLISKGLEDKHKISLIFILFTNSTIMAYMLSGWENIHQSLLILLAWYLMLFGQGIRNFIIIGIISALAILMRVDSIFIISSLFAYMIYKKTWREFAYSCIAGLSVGLLYLYFQLSWFDYITPTTARLKTGFTIDLLYNFKYMIKLVVYGSCFTYITYYIISFLRKRDLKASTVFISIGVIVNLIYAFFVSDFFPHGRMYIASFVILTFAYYVIEKRSVNINFIILVTSIAVIPNFIKNIGNPATATTTATATATQYLLSKEIKKSITPEDGAIGLFYLGAISFALPEYEIADFLGKADEMIAQSEGHIGQPIGHNKFNPQKSIKKWNVAALPFPEEKANINIEEELETIKNKPHHYYYSLTKLALIKSGYIFCMPNIKLNWGVYVRKDLVSKFKNCETLTN